MSSSLSLAATAATAADASSPSAITLPASPFSYTPRDVSLYSLGIGLGSDPLNPQDLTFINEFDKKFRVFPTFGVLPPTATLAALTKAGAIPGLEFDYRLLLHGRQELIVHRPLQAADQLVNEATVIGIQRKGEAAVLTLEVNTRSTAPNAATSSALITNRFTFFIRRAVFAPDFRPLTFTDSAFPSGVKFPPSNPPSIVVSTRIPDNAALIYRLSGDLNPLHSDPALAKSVGFPRPILHGLASLGKPLVPIHTHPNHQNMSHPTSDEFIHSLSNYVTNSCHFSLIFGFLLFLSQVLPLVC
jgi:hypothetical protein